MSLHTGGRGFPDRIRPPGDRYQDSPRDRGAPWDPERRRERDHPRDRDRAHGESRDRDRRPRGEVSPGRPPRHWEDRRTGECLDHCFRLSSRQKIGKVSGFIANQKIERTFPRKPKAVGSV